MLENLGFGKKNVPPERIEMATKSHFSEAMMSAYEEVAADQERGNGVREALARVHNITEFGSKDPVRTRDLKDLDDAKQGVADAYEAYLKNPTVH